MLELIDIECPSPCTPERLRATEKRFKREIRFALPSSLNDQQLEELKALRKQLTAARASPEMEQARRQRNALYGRRADALRMRFALAVEALAAERGVPLDVAMLRRVLANPEVPQRLDSTEVEHLRTVAGEMVARALTHRTSAIAPAQP